MRECLSSPWRRYCVSIESMYFFRPCPTISVVVDKRWCGPSGELSFSAHRFLHERGDLCLFGGSQPLQREGGWPHVALVEFCLVTESQRRIPNLELRSILEEADDFAVLAR